MLPKLPDEQHTFCSCCERGRRLDHIGPVLLSKIYFLKPRGQNPETKKDEVRILTQSQSSFANVDLGKATTVYCNTYTVLHNQPYLQHFNTTTFELRITSNDRITHTWNINHCYRIMPNMKNVQVRHTCKHRL